MQEDRFYAYQINNGKFTISPTEVAEYHGQLIPIHFDSLWNIISSFDDAISFVGPRFSPSSRIYFADRTYDDYKRFPKLYQVRSRKIQFEDDNIGELYLQFNAVLGAIEFKPDKMKIFGNACKTDRNNIYYTFINVLEQKYIFNSIPKISKLAKQVLTSFEYIHDSISKTTYSILSQYQTKSTRNKRNRTKAKLENLFRSTGGWIFILTYSGATYYKLKVSDEEIKRLTWVPPWTPSIVKYLNYLEIDGTFRVARPYVAFIWQGISNNKWISLCLTISPKETEAAYSYSMQCFDKISPKLNNNIKKLPVLADQGSVIKKFCKNAKMLHFWCHFHLKQNFGTNSKLFPYINELLNNKNSKLFYSDLKIKLLKICDLFELSNQQEVKRLRKLLNEDNVWRLALWERIPYGMIKASNHCEGFHAFVNSRIASLKCVEIKLFECIRCMISQYNSFLDDPFSNAKDSLIKLAKTIGSKNDNTLILSYCCYKNQINMVKYGIDLPCPHRYSSSVDYKEMFSRALLILLEKFPNSYAIVEKISSNELEEYAIRSLNKPFNDRDGEIDKWTRYLNSKFQISNIYDFQLFYKRLLNKLSREFKFTDEEAHISIVLLLFRNPEKQMVSSEENVILRSIEVISMAVQKEFNQQAINELKNDLELFLRHEEIQQAIAKDQTFSHPF